MVGMHLSRNRKYLSTISFLLGFIACFALLSRLASDGLFLLITWAAFIPIALWLAIQVTNLLDNYNPFDSPVDPSNKAVFITGCASGFGFKLAQTLDSLGFTVFAGCRVIDDKRAESLRNVCSNRLQLVKCDINSHEDVKAAVNLVKSTLGTKSLWALVNNAAVIKLHGIDWGEEGVEDYKWMMDTNALGSIRVTKAFLPLLKRTKHSRVLMVGSIAGRIEFPGMAAYSMSKFALRCFSNALRRELRTFDVYVSVVEPVLFGTPLTEKKKLLQGLDETWDRSPDEVKEAYSKEIRDNLYSSVEAMLSLSHPDNSKVIETMTKIVVTSQEPDYFYKVSSAPELMSQYMFEIFPPELTDDYMFGPLFVLMCKILGYAILVIEQATRLAKGLLKHKIQ